MIHQHFLLLNVPWAPNPLVVITPITPGKGRQSPEQQGEWGWEVEGEGRGGRVPPSQG